MIVTFHSNNGDSYMLHFDEKHPTPERPGYAVLPWVLVLITFYEVAKEAVYIRLDNAPPFWLGLGDTIVWADFLALKLAGVLHHDED